MSDNNQEFNPAGDEPQEPIMKEEPTPKTDAELLDLMTSSPGGPAILLAGLEAAQAARLNANDQPKDPMPVANASDSDVPTEAGQESGDESGDEGGGEGETDAPISGDHIYPGLLAPNMLRRLFPTHPAERPGGASIPVQNSYSPLPYLFSDAAASSLTGQGSFLYTLAEIDQRRIRALIEEAAVDPAGAVMAAFLLRIAVICDAMSAGARFKMVSSTGEPALASLWPLHQFDSLPASFVNTIVNGGGNVVLGGLPGAGTPPANTGHPDLYQDALRMHPTASAAEKLQYIAMDVIVRTLRYVAAKLGVTTSWRA